MSTLALQQLEIFRAGGLRPNVVSLIATIYLTKQKQNKKQNKKYKTKKNEL